RGGIGRDVCVGFGLCRSRASRRSVSKRRRPCLRLGRRPPVREEPGQRRGRPRRQPLRLPRLRPMRPLLPWGGPPPPPCKRTPPPRPPPGPQERPAPPPAPATSGAAPAAASASGTQPAGPVETLQDALSAAYSTNPSLLAARAQQRALDET